MRNGSEHTDAEKNCKANEELIVSGDCLRDLVLLVAVCMMRVDSPNTGSVAVLGCQCECRLPVRPGKVEIGSTSEQCFQTVDVSIDSCEVQGSVTW